MLGVMTPSVVDNLLLKINQTILSCYGLPNYLTLNEKSDHLKMFLGISFACLLYFNRKMLRLINLE